MRLVPHEQTRDRRSALMRLLVVILTAAIFTAIAIPVYLGEQSRARVSVVDAALQTVQQQVATRLKNGKSLSDSLLREAIHDAGYNYINASQTAYPPNGIYFFMPDSDSMAGKTGDSSYLLVAGYGVRKTTSWEYARIVNQAGKIVSCVTTL